MDSGWPWQLKSEYNFIYFGPVDIEAHIVLSEHKRTYGNEVVWVSPNI
jgi:hypothetical protein